jgi:hypothetical protein
MRTVMFLRCVRSGLHVRFDDHADGFFPGDNVSHRTFAGVPSLQHCIVAVFQVAADPNFAMLLAGIDRVRALIEFMEIFIDFVFAAA